MAAVGSDVSPTITIDAKNPELVLQTIDEHSIFIANQNVSFHWTCFDHNPASSPTSFMAQMIIDSTIAEEISWYPDITEFTWDITMPAVQSANCRIEVVAIDLFGNSTTEYTYDFTILLSTSGAPDAPMALTLGSPAPNPFNPATTVQFSAPAGSVLSLSVYDTRGCKVRNLMHGISGSGIVSARWDGLDQNGRPQPAGAYMFVLDAQTTDGAERLTCKAMLIP